MPGETKSKEDPDYKEKCKTLKRKLRFLIHEQECFQEELRKGQRKLLKVSRDKSFLLDRLLQYERVVFSGSDSEPTDSSDEEKETKDAKDTKEMKKPVQVPTTEKPKVRRKPKKRPTKKLQVNPKLGQGNTVLPIQLQSPPNALKHHMPQLVEILNRAATASMGPVSPDAFAGLPYSPAYALPMNPAHLSQVYEQMPPSASVLPSLLMNPHFSQLSRMRKMDVGMLEVAEKPGARKRVRKDSTGKSASQLNTTKVTKPPQPPLTKLPQSAEDQQMVQTDHEGVKTGKEGAPVK